MPPALALLGVGMAVLLPSLRAQGGPEIEKLTLKESGDFAFDGLDFALVQFGPAWERVYQKNLSIENGSPIKDEKSWEVRGTLPVKGSDSLLAVRQQVVASDNAAFGVSYQIALPDSWNDTIKELAIDIRLPLSDAGGRPILLDGEPFRLPADTGDMVVLPGARVTSLTLPSATGSILVEGSGPMTVRVEDMRAWKYPSLDYRVRIQFPLSAGISHTALDLNLQYLAGRDDSAGEAAPAFVIGEDSEWAPYENSLEIEPGGVFDFSFLKDAPAGKHGPLKAGAGGHFEFAGHPGKPVRFWGVNLCLQAVYLNNDEAATLAERLAASGYNAVRLHHYDAYLIQKGERSDSRFNPDQLDKLDYLFSALKRQGIYLAIDLFTVRSWFFTKEEKAEMNITPEGDALFQFKTLIPVSSAAMDNWKRFSRTLLTHRNPHTGLTWAEDPSLFLICPVNEDVITEEKIASMPSVFALYKKAFDEWWTDAANREKSGDNPQIGYTRFVSERRIAADEEMNGFLRGLGVKALLTGANFHTHQHLAYQRERYDVVDNHHYWAHPKRLPGQGGTEKNPFTLFSQHNPVTSSGEVPRGIMQSRIWGKPYTVTEFNFLSPNQYRAAGGVLMPAYSSLQDWSALFNFEYASRESYAMRGGTARKFSLTADPLGLLADRVSALLFRRNDIAPGKGRIGFAVRAPEAFKMRGALFPEIFTKVGLVSRIGSGTGLPERQIAEFGLDAVVVEGRPGEDLPGKTFRADETLFADLIAAGVLPPDSVNSEETRFVSDTGEITLDAGAGAMKVVAGRGELFVLPTHQELEGGVASVKNGGTFATVSVIALDEKPLAQSGRILVLHLTDVLPAGTRFSGPDRTILENFGELPFLVKKGETDLTLRLASTGKTYRAWAVDSTGRRVRPAALEKSENGWNLSLKTVDSHGTQLAYEISLE